MKKIRKNDVNKDRVQRSDYRFLVSLREKRENIYQGFKNIHTHGEFIASEFRVRGIVLLFPKFSQVSPGAEKIKL